MFKHTGYTVYLGKMQNSIQLTDSNVFNLYQTEKHNQNYEVELSFSVKSKNSCSISLIQFV